MKDDPRTAGDSSLITSSLLPSSRTGFRPTALRQIDAFGVFCPDNEKVYIIPIDDLPLAREAKLRLEAPRNSQAKGIRWAAAYEI